MHTFAMRFREALRRKRVTAPALARIAEVSVPYIYDLINARATNPSQEKVLALAKALEVPVGWLLNGEGDLTPTAKLKEPEADYRVKALADTFALTVRHQPLAAVNLCRGFLEDARGGDAAALAKAELLLKLFAEHLESPNK